MPRELDDLLNVLCCLDLLHGVLDLLSLTGSGGCMLGTLLRLDLLALVTALLLLVLHFFVGCLIQIITLCKLSSIYKKLQPMRGQVYHNPISVRILS